MPEVTAVPPASAGPQKLIEGNQLHVRLELQCNSAVRSMHAVVHRFMADAGARRQMMLSAAFHYQRAACQRR